MNFALAVAAGASHAALWHRVLASHCHADMPLHLLQVQGVLMSAAERWPHIHISDSLVMADTAVGMAEAGCK